jgi:DNA-binding transcriptional MerR regulator
MLTIGEFARLGSVSARMLRHYDSIGLLRPAAVDPATGYRRYLATQLPELYRIVALRASGLTLGEIASLIARGSGEAARAVLQARATELEREIAQATRGLQVVRSQLAALGGSAGLADDIVVRMLPILRVVAVRGPAPGFGPRRMTPLLRPAFDELRSACAGARIVRTGAPFVFYTGRPDAGDLVFHAAFPVADDVDGVAAPAELFELPAVEEAACVARRGPAATMYPGAYGDLRHWMEATGYRHPGGRRNIFLQIGTVRPEDELREINLPLQRSGSRGPDLTPRRLGGHTRSRSSRRGAGGARRGAADRAWFAPAEERR